MEIPTFSEIKLLDTEAAWSLSEDLVSMRGARRALLNSPGLSEDDAEELAAEVEHLSKLIRFCRKQAEFGPDGTKGVRDALKRAESKIRGLIQEQQEARLEIKRLQAELKKSEASRQSALLTVRMLREQNGHPPVAPVKTFRLHRQSAT